MAILLEMNSTKLNVVGEGNSQCMDCGGSFDPGPLLFSRIEAFFGRGLCADCRALNPLDYEV